MAIKLDNIELINLQNHAGSNALTLNGSDTNVTFSGTVTATYFYGNGSNLTNISASDDTKLPLAGGTLSGALTASGGISGLTLSNGISGTNFNISGVNQLTINDPGEGIVFGGGSAGNITLAVVDDSNDNIVRFTNAAYLQVGTSTVWHAGNDGSGSGLDADKVDNYHASQFFRRIAKATATVGPGWMTVAENASGRRAGEIIVTDADSGDHAYIRIEWMRSYSDSNFTVLNCGGHSNRITGARVLYNTSDNTYGVKKLQVYVTTSSNYEVNIYEQGDIDDYSTHSVVTPVIQSTISGYAVHGKELINLDTFGFAAEEGILSGGDLKVLGTGNGIHVDSTGHASLRLDRGSTSYDSNVLFMTAGGIKWRLWQDGTDDQLMIRDDTNSYNSVVFNAGGEDGYTTFNNPIIIGGTSSPSAELHVESTTSSSSSNMLRLKSLTAAPSAPVRMIDFVRSNNSTRGYISMNQYGVQYSTSSDYRLKRNVTPMENSIDRIKLLKPSRFNWVEGPDDYVVDGFIAHEVQDVVHDAVSGEKDAVDENNEPAYQGIDQSKLVPLLTAALQEAILKIEQLEARIQTLENN